MSDDGKTYTVHYEGPHSPINNYVKGMKVGGPYKSKQRARNVVDKKDNEYGSYVHRIREYGQGHDMTQHGEGKGHGE